MKEREDAKMSSKNYTDVLIGGKIYTLGGLEEESYLQQVASYINEKLAELHRQNGFLKQSEDYQSVMVYLNLADDYFKEREHARVLSDQKAELEKEAYSLKHELVGAQMKLESMLQEMKSRKGRGKASGEEAGEAETSGLKERLTAASMDGRMTAAESETEKLRERLNDAEKKAEEMAAESRRMAEQMAAMRDELEKYKALEAARDSIKAQKGHR